MKHPMPDVRLERLVDALGDDLAEASDLELIEAARDLRMDLTLRGSAAFLGVEAAVFPVSPASVLERVTDRRSRSERTRLTPAGKVMSTALQVAVTRVAALWGEVWQRFGSRTSGR